MSNTKHPGYASRIIALSLFATAPMAVHAAGQPLEPAAATSEAEPAASAKQAELVCRTVDRPGSHIKQRLCAPAEEWAAARDRLSLLRNNLAASLPTGQNISTAGSSFSFQR